MKIGHHICKLPKKSVYASIKHNIDELEKYEIVIKTIAIFVMGPQSRSFNIDESEYEDIKKCNLEIYVHNSYLSYPWESKNKALCEISQQLDICQNIDAKGFVIHLPKLGIDEVIIVLKKLYDVERSVKIYLEIPAVKEENAIYSSPKNLNILFDRISNEIDKNLDNFGLCIDTAHLWSSGVDISTYKNMYNWINEINIPPNNILIHCNDNTKELGKSPDCHTNISLGKIWNNYKDNLEDSGLYALLKYATINQVPIILERGVSKLLYTEYLTIYKLSKNTR